MRFGYTGDRLRLRPFTERDRGAVEEILDATWAHDRRLRALHGGGHGPSLDEPFRRTLVAEVCAAVVGAGTILHGRFHTRHALLDLDVAPQLRRRGVGTELLGQLRAIAPAPLCVRARYDQEGAVPFVRRHGFELLNRPWEGRFDPADVVARVPEPNVDEPPSMEEASVFFARWYRDTHHWNPPASMSLEDARSLFCGDNVVPGSLVGVREDGRLIAAGNLIQPPGYDPGDEVYLVWVGAHERADDAAMNVVAACVRFALEARKALRFELDESNASVWTALDRFGVLGEPAFGIFAEDG